MVRLQRPWMSPVLAIAGLSCVAAGLACSDDTGADTDTDGDGNEAGPDLLILGPENLQPFEEGTSVFQLSLRATGLTLVEPGAPDDGQSGYLEVSLDGDPLTALNPITSGEIGAGIFVDVDAGEVLGGGHRVEVQAFRPDGTPFANPGANARGVFFVRRGTHDVPGSTPAELPLVVITSPWPGDTVDRSEDLTLEVSTLNWNWIDASVLGQGTEGHAHVYFDVADYPACQPDCNLQYRAIMQPETSTMVNGQTLALPITLQESDGQNGPLSMSVSLHNSDHTIYPASPLPGDSPAEQQAALDLLAVDTIEVAVE